MQDMVSEALKILDEKKENIDDFGHLLHIGTIKVPQIILQNLNKF